jgi:decaprenyl-phosphate phosphoribosyltransferase
MLLEINMWHPIMALIQLEPISKIIKYFQLARLNNWTKNLIIFSPLFFAGRVSNIILLQQSLIAFVSFSFLTSSIYILNDYMDLEQDRIHPSKKNRPLVSGKVPIAHAGAMAIVLLIVGLGIIFQLSIDTFFVSLSYVIIMVAYCLVFRKMALVDIGIIATGFVIRLYVGSTVTGIPNSMWIIIMIFLLALFISLAKRRDDLTRLAINEANARESLNGYNITLVDSLIIVLVPIIIVSYILYCTADENITRVGNNLYLTSVFVFFGFVRYLQLIFVKKLGGDPMKLLYRDAGIQLVLILWITSFAWILYF